MKKEFELEAISVALIEEFGNAHGLTQDQALDTIVREFMIGEFKNQARESNKVQVQYTNAWYQKGNV